MPQVSRIYIQVCARACVRACGHAGRRACVHACAETLPCISVIVFNEISRAMDGRGARTWKTSHVRVCTAFRLSSYSRRVQSTIFFPTPSRRMIVDSPRIFKSHFIIRV